MESGNLVRVRSMLLDSGLSLEQKGAVLLEYLRACGVTDTDTDTEVRKILQAVIDSASNLKERRVLALILNAMLSDAIPGRQLQ